MSAKKIFNIVEIDQDYCTRTFGVGTCTAALGPLVANKCWNTEETCALRSAYLKGLNTLKFCEATFPLKDGNYMPRLVSVGGYEQVVNIAGFDNTLSGIGRRAKVQIVLADEASRDVLTDKYWDQRISGAAQFDGVGYDPIRNGSFWSKFKARFPNYSGRALRVRQAEIVNGSVSIIKTRHYVIDNIKGPDDRGRVTIDAKDILSLADDEKAVAPKLSKGTLVEDLDATSGTFAVTNGASYPASGVLVIANEAMRYTRSGNVFSVQRGSLGSTASSHNQGDTVQLAYHIERKRGDLVIRELLETYGGIAVSWLDIAGWKSEFDKWGQKMILSATICKPTGVSKLLAEINQIGIAIWWDEVAQKIKIKLNHPPEDDPVTWTRESNMIAFSQNDDDSQRITGAEMWAMQKDVTKDLQDTNFSVSVQSVSIQSLAMFSSRTKRLNTRWLNHGDVSSMAILTGRILNRFKRSPVKYSVTVDIKDDPALTDIVRLDHYAITDVTGRPVQKLAQVTMRKDRELGVSVDVDLEASAYGSVFTRIGPNNIPRYGSATAAQKSRYAFIAPNSGFFSDGTPAYTFI